MKIQFVLVTWRDNGGCAVATRVDILGVILTLKRIGGDVFVTDRQAKLFD